MGKTYERIDGRLRDFIERQPLFFVTADRISDTCGYAVPFLDYREERTLHADYFGRKTDEEFGAYCAAKPHVPTSLDGLPALPVPLPPRPA
ncbi:hypothetical protein L6E12_29645 [Actinokineospora sp. PR83]|uniref:hypothetical protein n=1 Tax=Actinokineospora sp. PR83 TaxID=2884908 RepID=UPI001F46EB30|nr:hypothetical protein [Actinokineospora sp. PR83]MCG8919942.1 hypothetical protein [Actinokineospora sp. PR83]